MSTKKCSKIKCISSYIGRVFTFFEYINTLIFLVIFSCSAYGGIDSKTISKEIIIEDGIKTIKNSNIPLNGTINLNLTPILKIDPSRYKQIDISLISDAYKDSQGNIYLLDGKNLKIHKFNASGEYQISFLSKGPGPGELNQYPHILIYQDSLFAHGFNDKKVIQFNLDGKILKEKKFLNFYIDPIITDANHFIASEDIELIENPSKRVCLYSLESEKIEQIFMETKARGRIFVPFGKSKVAVEPEIGIIPDTFVKLDIPGKKCFIALNGEYKIYRKDFSGKTEMIIEKDFQPIELNTEDKNQIILKFGNVPAEAKNLLLKYLPDKMCAFRSIHILSGGCLAIERFIDYDKYDTDIFDKNGSFLYIFQTPAIKGLKVFKIIKDKLITIVEEEDTDMYIEYKINNLPKEMN